MSIASTEKFSIETPTILCCEPFVRYYSCVPLCAALGCGRIAETDS
jgi:hypothetical protein